MFEGEFELEAELEDLMASLSESELEEEAEAEAELYVPPRRDYGPPNRPAPLTHDQAVIQSQFVHGIKDENHLTDAVFYDRYPAWKNKSLKSGSPALRREWMQIRDSIVRPYLRNPPAIQPSVTPVPPPPAPHATPASTNTFGYSSFDNIRQYSPGQLPAAFNAQTAYLKVSGFLPWYKKITLAVPNVGIGESDTGVGNLVFSMDKRSFTDLVESKELQNKAVELAVHGLSSQAELIFTEEVIGFLGIGLTMLDIAQGLENERMLGGVGPDADKWRTKQQFQFVFGLLAEDISRNNWGNGYFLSRDSRALALELANRFAEFRPLFFQYQHYSILDEQLGQYQGNVPDNPPPHMDPAP